MPSPREIRAGAAFIVLYLKDRISAALTAAQRKLKAFGQAASDIGKQMLKATAEVLGHDDSLRRRALALFLLLQLLCRLTNGLLGVRTPRTTMFAADHDPRVAVLVHKCFRPLLLLCHTNSSIAGLLVEFSRLARPLCSESRLSEFYSAVRCAASRFLEVSWKEV